MNIYIPSFSHLLFLSFSLVCDHIGKHDLFKFHLACKIYLKPPIPWHISTNAREAVIVQIYSKILSISRLTSYPIPSQRYTIYHSLVHILIKISGGGGLKCKRVSDRPKARDGAVHLGIICVGLVVEFLINIPGRHRFLSATFFTIAEIIFLNLTYGGSQIYNFEVGRWGSSLEKRKGIEKNRN